MLKKIFFSIVFQGSAMLYAQEGILKVEVLDSLNKEGLEFVSIQVENAGVVIARGETDMKGVAVIKNLPSGRFEVKAAVTGYNKKMIRGVQVSGNGTTYLDFELSSGVIMSDFVIIDYEKPLVNEGTVIGPKYDREEIEKSALDPMELLKTSGVENKQGIAVYRGARPDGNVYIIDGQKVIGSANLPKMAIQQMSVSLGGIPAMYGDGTGAFIEIETRSGLVNPNKKWVDKK